MLKKTMIIVAVLILAYIVLQAAYSGYYMVRGRQLTKTTYTKGVEIGDKSKPKFRLLVVGDSVAAGVGASSFETSVSGRVAGYLAKENYVIFQSRAVSGLRLADMLNVENPADRQDLILMIVSSNDLFHFGSLAQFAKHAPKVFEKYSKLADHVIIVGPGRIFDAGAIPLFAKPIYKIQSAKYASILAENAAKYANFSYINPLNPPKGIVEDKNWSAGDKFHPGDNGYKFWFEMVKTAL